MTYLAHLSYCYQVHHCHPYGHINWLTCKHKVSQCLHTNTWQHARRHSLQSCTSVVRPQILLVLLRVCYILEFVCCFSVSEKEEGVSACLLDKKYKEGWDRYLNLLKLETSGCKITFFLILPKIPPQASSILPTSTFLQWLYIYIVLVLFYSDAETLGYYSDFLIDVRRKLNILEKVVGKCFKIRKRWHSKHRPNYSVKLPIFWQTSNQTTLKKPTRRIFFT